MANTYKFHINAVDVHTELNGLSKVIYNVHYSYLGSDENGNSASIIGVKSLEAPDSENFTAFEDLIQDDIIAWIEPLMDLEQMQANIDAIIAEKVAPTKQTLQVPISLDPIVDETTTEETVTEETVTEETNTDQPVVDASETEQVAGQESAATEETTEETV